MNNNSSFVSLHDCYHPSWWGSLPDENPWSTTSCQIHGVVPVYHEDHHAGRQSPTGTGDTCNDEEAATYGSIHSTDTWTVVLAGPASHPCTSSGPVVVAPHAHMWGDSLGNWKYSIVHIMCQFQKYMLYICYAFYFVECWYVHRSSCPTLSPETPVVSDTGACGLSVHWQHTRSCR